VLIWESNANSPETILDASTGLPLTGILNVQEGPSHGCAALSGGGVECWATNTFNNPNGNAYGQLGNGTTTPTSVLYRATPVLTASATPLTNIVSIAPGNFPNTACAVTSDGKLWCWGDLTWLVNKGTSLVTGYAQAITMDGTTPLAGVSSAWLGSNEACAILSGAPNSVWCWGYNAHGELGQGDTNTRQYPTKVLGLTGPTKVAFAGPTFNVCGDTVCALDGSNVRCWGSNCDGTAGTNTATNPVQSPTAVVLQNGALLAGVEDLQAGYGEFAALQSDASIWTWGNGFQNYAANYGVTNVLAIGWAGPASGNGPRYLTSDGIYHNAMTNLTVNCNAM
jgi:alpha-tubulin suppressor-like RCC1 family protein